MSDLGFRYARDRRGYLEIPVPDDSLLLNAFIRQSTTRDVTPGLIRLGVAGLAEHKGWTVRRTRAALEGLRGYVLVDEVARVMFVVGTVHEDPPRSLSQITAMARQLLNLPRCAPVEAAAAEVAASIKNSEKSLRDKWEELYSAVQSAVHSAAHGAAPTPTPRPNPIHTPTQTPTPTKNQSTGADAPARAQADRAQDDPTQALLCRLMRDSFDDDADVHWTQADHVENIKRKCAELRISYGEEPDAIHRAFKAVEYERGKRAQRGPMKSERREALG